MISTLMAALAMMRHLFPCGPIGLCGLKKDHGGVIII